MDPSWVMKHHPVFSAPKQFSLRGTTGGTASALRYREGITPWVPTSHQARRFGRWRVRVCLNLLKNWETWCVLVGGTQGKSSQLPVFVWHIFGSNLSVILDRILMKADANRLPLAMMVRKLSGNMT